MKIGNLDIYKYREDFHYVPKFYGRVWKKLKERDSLFEETHIEDSLFTRDKLYVLYQSLKNVQKHNPKLIEFGVYRGGSSYFIASIAEKLFTNPIMWSVDSFEGNISVSKEEKSGRYADGSYEYAQNRLSRFPFVNVVQSDVREFKIGLEEYDFVHCDVDLSIPTQYILENLVLSKKGLIVVNNYGFGKRKKHGIREVVDDIIQSKSYRKFEFDTGQCVLMI